MAPQTKYSKDRVDKICGFILQGRGRAGSARLSGINPVTMLEWMDAYPEFREKVLAAEDQYEQDHINQIVFKDFTPERIEKIERALKSGNTRFTACRSAGISLITLLTWMDIHPEFAEKVHTAEAFAESVNVNNVLKAATNGSWQASAWWLERRVPEHWGRMDRVDLVIRKDQAEQAARELRAEGIYVTADELLKESDEVAQRALPVPGSGKSKHNK